MNSTQWNLKTVEDILEPFKAVKILSELYEYDLNQPIDKKVSLEVSRSLIALGWNKTGKAFK